MCNSFCFPPEHLNHIRSITGVDHIGLGGDYNGVAVTPEGLEDVSKYPDLFDMLADGVLRTGETFQPWTREDLQKLAGLNLLRVFREVERIRDSLVEEDPFEDLIPYEEFVRANVADQPCMTDMEMHKS